MIPRACLITQRLLLPAWVGAAILFVVTSVAEQQFAGFAPAMKNQLALIRFPKYYAFGFATLLVSGLCSLLRVTTGHRDRGSKAMLGLLILALLLMLADLIWIYRPLAELMTDLERPRDDTFTWYHEASKYINAAGMLLAAVAAVIACRTRSDAGAAAATSN